jgi:hypothetical protein
MPTSRIRIIRHEPVPQSGSFEVRFADGRPVGISPHPSTAEYPPAGLSGRCRQQSR